MNYTPIQLEAISIFGRKELTEGCITKIKGELVRIHKDNFYIISDTGEGYYYYDSYSYESFNNGDRIQEKYEIVEIKIEEILGHIPHLEDVFRVAEEKGKLVEIDSRFNELTFYHIDKYGENDNDRFFQYNTTLPLLSQPEETLTQLISLFK